MSQPVDEITAKRRVKQGRCPTHDRRLVLRWHHADGTDSMRCPFDECRYTIRIHKRRPAGAR